MKLGETYQRRRNAELVTTFAGHTAAHYGHLVVYARLKGIVPSASRG